MRRVLSMPHRRWWFVSAILVAGISLLWVQTAFAPPKPGGGPKKPAGGPAKPAGRPAKPAGKAGPRKAPRGAPAKGKPSGPKARGPGGPGAKPPRGIVKPRARKGPHRRYVRGARYWRPYHVHRPATPVVYTTLGYPYYVGGTSYVYVPSSSSGQSVSPPSETVIVSPGSESSEAFVSSADQVDDPYIQILELVELSHEWRTMNESPSVHERITSAQAAGEVSDVISSIRDYNLEFDKVTRDAMRKLSKGHSAALELASARDYLEELIELVDKLPEIKSAG